MSTLLINNSRLFQVEAQLFDDFKRSNRISDLSFFKLHNTKSPYDD